MFYVVANEVRCLIVRRVHRCTQHSGFIGCCHGAQCSGYIGVCSRWVTSLLTMPDALSASLSLTEDKRREVRGISPCQGWCSVYPIFIVVSKVRKPFSVVADRRGVNRNGCVCTSCAMVSVVSDKRGRVTRQLRYCMMQMFNVI